MQEPKFLWHSYIYAIKASYAPGLIHGYTAGIHFFL